MSLSAQSRPHFLAVVTLLDELDPKECNWPRLSVILPGRAFVPEKFLVLFDGAKSNIEFSRMVSKFLMDRDRAGSLWVNLQTYVSLAIQLLSILRDK
jgi:hypothetical protein